MIKIAALVALSAVACFARSPVLTEKACIDQPKILAEVAGLGIDAGLLASNHMKVKMNFAIVDVGANLKAFLRMDGAWLGSKDIAIKKAKTSTFFNMETGMIGALSQPGGPLYNIEHSNGGLITFPGGIPVKNCKGELIGAVGVSGSTVANDHAVAKAIVDAMEKHKDGTILRKALDTSRMNQELALAGLFAGFAASEDKGLKMDLAVVDVGANLKAFIRMDDAWLGSVDIAIKKAKTSAFFNMESGTIGTLSQPGGFLYNIEHSNGGLISFPGGINLRNSKDELIGAVGVSGDSVANDRAVAQAMIKAMGKANW